MTPDVLADNWADIFGGPADVDAIMDEWLFHNRRAEAANAVSLGRAPNPDLYGGLGPDDLLDSPYEFARLYGSLDEAIRHVVDAEAGEAADYAARAFRRVRPGSPAPWEMSEADWVAEYRTFREATEAILEEAGGDFDAVDPEDADIFDRLEELVPDGIEDPERPQSPQELYRAMLDLARIAGYLR